MVVRPIRNDQDHAAALLRIDQLLQASEGSDERDELEVLAILVDAYEDSRWPITHNPHFGSSFEDFLKEEGIYEEVVAHAIKRVLAYRSIKPEIDAAIAEGLGDVRAGRLSPSFKNLKEFEAWLKTDDEGAGDDQQG